MFGHIVALILLGLGINKSFYAPNPNVMGAETVATSTASQLPPRTSFRLNPQNFASKSATARPGFDMRAFGAAVTQTQMDFAGVESASKAAAFSVFTNHRAQLEQQLTLVKDPKRQAIVETINTNCQTVNQKRTDAMTAMLSKLSTILMNVSNRAASASAAGKDTTHVNTAITTAQGTIADAQNAVASQSGTPCLITITSDATVKTDVGNVVSGLQKNLQSVYATVMIAKKSVGDAVRVLATLTGESL